MSRSPGNSKPDAIGTGKIADRFREAVILEANKPDLLRQRDHGSPVSPLRTTGGGPAVSSSSGSSGSFSGKTGSKPVSKKSSSAPIHSSNSGELSGSSDNSPTASRSGGNVRASKLKAGDSRSNSGSGATPKKHSGQTVNSPPLNVLPAGNICPSGKVINTGMANKNTKSDVLGYGTGNYGHGSIMRGGAGRVDTSSTRAGIGSDSGKRGVESVDPEQLKLVGNEHYKRGEFSEALSFYDRAVASLPRSASYRSNRAAALIGLGRLSEAVRECQQALNFDPDYDRAHHRLASLFIRLGQVENARRHLCHPGLTPNPTEMLKLQLVDKHITKCTGVRRVGDWKSVLRELDGASTAGADASPQLFMCRAEALLQLRQIDDAESVLSHAPKSDPQINNTPFEAIFFGMFAEAYSNYVRSQIEMALGRFENAVTSIEKANKIDPQNIEIAVMLNNVRKVARARTRGNDLFKSERFTEASSAYGDGLKLDPTNSVLYCNRAACWYKLGLWQKSVEDSNQALHYQPNYTKALLRRATSYNKLQKWEEAVKDYEVLRKELPNDNDVAEAHFHAHVSLKKSRGEEVTNLKFGGEVERVSGLEQLRTAISSSGVSVVHFEAASNSKCRQISPFLDTLCTKHPSVNFLKVDIHENAEVATVENVRVVPTFKIYKNGNQVKVIVCPSRDVLEQSVKHYSL
ncbi:unnamed protein product [Lathyrus sativus]|nr:unnamed protein product [Lathyrus sativus]